MFKKEKEHDEVVVTAATMMAENAAQEAEEADKGNIFKRVSGLVSAVQKVGPTVQEVGNNVNEFYVNWIKPIYDNRAQIKRRLNAISTVFSIIFFVLYVPFLLFSKIASGLSLGWEIALYSCVGVYAVMLAILLIVTLASGKSNSTESAKRRKRATKIVLYIVRIASVAIAITALAISSTAEGADNPALSTVFVVFSIVSIVFSALPLFCGGVGGVFKWLISPAKIKRTVSFVALEWYGLLTSPNTTKPIKRVNKKYYEAIAKCLDLYILPALGDRYAKSVTVEELNGVIAGVSEEERELTKAVVKNVFDYAFECGYVQSNPCEELALPESIEQAVESTRPESKQKKFFRSLFQRKNDKE